MNYKNIPEITEKQKAIVDLVFRFRFINRKQIQKIMDHKDPKRINVWLKDLVNKGYLGRIYSNKLLENTKPAIYYLNNNGILWIRAEKGWQYRTKNEELDFKHVKKFYEDKNASQTFIDHCVAISELCVQFNELEKKENTKEKNKLEYSCITKTENWILKKLDDEEDFDEIKHCIPDIFCEKIINPEDDGIDSTTFFLELIDSHVPRYALRHKVDAYFKFHEEINWKLMYTGLDRKFPAILFVLQNPKKLAHLKKHIKEQFERSFDVEDMVFKLTTYKEAVEKGLEGDIWKIVKDSSL